jgi:hypothetical protein
VPRTRSWKLKSSSAVVGSRAPKSRISCCAIRIFSELCRRCGNLFVSRRVFTGRTHTQVLSQPRTDSARTVTRRRRQLCGARARDTLLQLRQAPRRDPDAKATGAFRPCIMAFSRRMDLDTSRQRGTHCMPWLAASLHVRRLSPARSVRMAAAGYEGAGPDTAWRVCAARQTRS